MIPKEYQKSNLALELKAGKKRLEDALHALSDEQCERAGGARSGSVMVGLAPQPGMNLQRGTEGRFVQRQLQRFETAYPNHSCNLLASVFRAV